MDRAEIRKLYKSLEHVENKQNLIDFTTDVYGEQAGKIMEQIIREENLIQIDNMNRKLAELENEVDSEVFTSKTEIKKFVVKEEDKIWE